MYTPWNFIKRTFAQFSDSGKRPTHTLNSVHLKTINKSKPNEPPLVKGPVLKKRRIAVKESVALTSLVEPRALESDFPTIDSHVQDDYESSSSIFSGFSKDLQLFSPLEAQTYGTEETENPAAKEIPMRNPRRRLHQVASKFKKLASHAHSESEHIRKRYSSSHFSFDASETVQLFRPPPPPDLNSRLVLRPVNIPCSQVMRLASENNLDESAVGSLLVILSEDDTKAR